ncbi:hypothetical protein C7460_10497 [Marinoscillum furvescens DSM 4134]|uniref:Uncharacterized protein n=2 Tax=Marinoscillum furvescens TaxID=1026 RepID=A0A3D9L877_MARFU|nr:hypothetical protein C7460_10497 [Marinoscillum furvescens DSM 4134]
MASSISSISVFDKTWCQAENIEQFRREDLSRRNGLNYYVLYQDENGSVLIEQTVTNETDPKWIQKAIDMGLIFMKKVDHEITLASWKARDAK